MTDKTYTQSDAERAIEWLKAAATSTDIRLSEQPIGWRSLAAEFAAVRAPLERRIAELEAALHLARFRMRAAVNGTPAWKKMARRWLDREGKGAVVAPKHGAVEGAPSVGPPELGTAVLDAMLERAVREGYEAGSRDGFDQELTMTDKGIAAIVKRVKEGE